jgi:hypothetical protein
MLPILHEGKGVASIFSNYFWGSNLTQITLASSKLTSKFHAMTTSLPTLVELEKAVEIKRQIEKLETEFASIFRRTARTTTTTRKSARGFDFKGYWTPARRAAKAAAMLKRIMNAPDKVPNQRPIREWE